MIEAVLPATRAAGSSPRATASRNASPQWARLRLGFFASLRLLKYKPRMSNARDLTSAALLLSISTVASRVLGFVREMVIAAKLGAGAETDAYLAAFAIPDLINHFLAGGALSAALLPLFARLMLNGNEEQAWRLVSRVISTAGLVLVVALTAGWIFAEPVLAALYPGWDEPQIALTAKLTRIILPGPLLFTIGALINATEQARKRFMATALTGLVYNACIIVGGIAGHQYLGVEGFSWGVIVGMALGPFLIPIVSARDVLRFRPDLNFRDPDVRRFFFLAAPLLLSSSLIFFDEWFQRHFASHLEAGAITWLNNARRLMLVPAALVGQAIGQASFAFLSRMRSESEPSEINEVLGGVLRATAALSVVTAFGIWCVAESAVRFAFLRGEYLPSDAAATTALLLVLAWAVPGWSLYTVGAKALQAAERMWLSAGLGLATLVPSWFVYQRLCETHGVDGLAIATVLCVTVASVAILTWLPSTYRSAPWRPVLTGLAEGAAVGAAGLLATSALAAVPFDVESSLVAVTIRSMAFLAGAGAVAYFLPGALGERLRRALARR